MLYCFKPYGYSLWTLLPSHSSLVPGVNSNGLKMMVDSPRESSKQLWVYSIWGPKDRLIYVYVGFKPIKSFI